jgi:hypothetical protein
MVIHIICHIFIKREGVEIKPIPVKFLHYEETLTGQPTKSQPRLFVVVKVSDQSIYLPSNLCTSFLKTKIYALLVGCFHNIQGEFHRSSTIATLPGYDDSVQGSMIEPGISVSEFLLCSST